MSLFDRMVAGEFRKSMSEPVATLAIFATDEPTVATVATVAATQKIQPLTTSQLNELRRLIDLACDPHEREAMFADALPFGIDSLITYRRVVAELSLTALDQAE